MNVGCDLVEIEVMQSALVGGVLAARHPIHIYMDKFAVKKRCHVTHSKIGRDYTVVILC